MTTAPVPSRSPLPPEPLPADGPSDADRAARIAWSLLAEPTDPLALLACDTLGPVRALELADHGSAADLVAALLGEEAQGEGPDGEQAAAAAGGRGRGTAGAVAADPALAPVTSTRTDQARLALDRWRRRRPSVDPDRAREDAGRLGIRVLVPGDRGWPASLADLGGAAPHCLWARGPADPAELCGGSAVAVVGSRASTPYGEDAAGHLSSGMAARGAAIVSGGAYGIDAAAHRGALAAGHGSTIAVLAGGLDRLYPRGNTALLEEVARTHLLLSEAPPGTAPTRWRFLARNRVIAALSDVVVVVEAAWRSGALSTARHADELSRPVAAVPGPIGSAASAGCHRLVRERGAVLVTEVDEVLELLPGAPAADGGAAAVQDELDLLPAADRRVLDAVAPRSRTAVRSLVTETGIPPEQVTAAIARLTLLGYLTGDEDTVRRVRR